MTLGDLIKDYRNIHQMSMDDFASKSGLSKAYISLLEKNKHPKTGKPITPSIEKIKQVADAIEMNFNDVFNQIDGDVLLSGTKKATAPLPRDAIHYVPETTQSIPLVGTINCGIPLFADENIEGYIETPSSDITSGEVYFWLRAKGNSMSNIGIREGDLLLIRQQDDVDSGDIAVVSINDNDATLKRVIKKENAIILQPENSNYDTKIFIGKEMQDVKIRGRLMKMEKRF